MHRYLWGIVIHLCFSSLVWAQTDSLSKEVIREAYYRSYQYERVGDYENAIKALMPVYKAYPQGYTVNLRLGWLYYLKGNYANSLEHYGKAVRIAPSAFEPKLGYMLPLLAQARYIEVEQVAYQILGLDVYNYYGNLRLCYALRMQQKWNQAESVANKMLAVYPTDVQFLVELGLIKQAKGEVDTARSIFEDVLILDPENVIAREYVQKQE